MASTESDLRFIERVYSQWGHHPWLYRAQDPLTFLGRHRAIRRAAAEATGVSDGARVLEVGCGTGRNLRYLEERVGPSGKIVGLDYTDAMLDAARSLCRRRGWDNVRLIQGDAAVLEVGEEPFDGVLSVLAMSVVPEYRRALVRCRDVLRPGGVLSVCDARPFWGPLRALNGIVHALYPPTTAWDPGRDLPAAMNEVFGNADVRYFNSGGMFVARSTRD